MKLRELLALLALLAGILLIIGGNWLIWDWANSLIGFIDWQRFNQEWHFDAPLFIYRWGPEEWTGPYDLGLVMQILGAILFCIGIYIIGKYRE